MFENSNKKYIVEIAHETMKSHRLRNTMASIAIALTTILISLVCGAGISTINAIITEYYMNPGPGTRSAAIYGTLDTLEKVRKQPQVEFADIARNCTKGVLRNKEFSGNEVNLLAVNKEYYGHHYVDLISGEYPVKAQEILMSDTLAEKISMEMKPGQKFTLNLSVVKGDKLEVTPIEVTISGFYNNPLRDLLEYEELYTTEDFPDMYNTELGDLQSEIYTKFYSGQTGDQLVEQLSCLNEAVGGTGITYVMDPDYITEAIGFTAVLVLVMICGYFLIFNVFYISVINDIRFIGSLKTIGMTGKQIRSMFHLQVWRLGIGGIGIGIVVGTVMNVLVTYAMESMGFSFSRFYKVGISFVIAAVTAVVFSVVTIWLSSRKAFSLAAKVSPVEAAKYRASGRKKTVFAVISFAIGGILFCVLFTSLVGFDTEWMVNRMNETDIRVYQMHADQPMDVPYEPVADELVQKIKELDFVKESYIYYRAFDPQQKSVDNGWFPGNMGAIKLESRLQEILEQDHQAYAAISDQDYQAYAAEELPDIYSQYTIKDGNFITGIMGIEPKALPMEAENLNIYSGSLDPVKFEAGDYLIYHPYYGKFHDNNYIYKGLNAGEKLTLSFYNYERQEYVTKTFTVMAVVGKKPDNYAGAWDNPQVQITISEKNFHEIYGENYKQMVSDIRLNTSSDNQKEQLETINKLVADNLNPQLIVGSKYNTRFSEQIQKNQMVSIGLFVGIVFGIIGMMNIINTLVTEVLSTKLEYATLQAIGMTKRQMVMNIFINGLKMILMSIVIMVVIGYPVTKIVSSSPFTTGFVPSIYIMSCILVAISGILLSIGVGVVLTRVLNRRAVVERLREAE